MANASLRRALLGKVEPGREHGGHARDHGDAGFAHPGERSGRIEALDDRDRRARRERQAERDVEPEHVEERQQAEPDVVGTQREPGMALHLREVRGQRTVGEDRGLRRPGGAGREEQHGGIVVADHGDRRRTRRRSPPVTAPSASERDDVVPFETHGARGMGVGRDDERGTDGGERAARAPRPARWDRAAPPIIPARSAARYATTNAGPLPRDDARPACPARGAPRSSPARSAGTVVEVAVGDGARSRSGGPSHPARSRRAPTTPRRDSSPGSYRRPI